MKVKIKLLVLMLFSCYGTVVMQENALQNPLEPKFEIKETNCEQNNLFLSALYQNTDRNELIIVVSHLAKNEKRETARRRLHNAATFLMQGFRQSILPSSGSIITAEGQAAADKGHLDFFVKGRLELRIFLGKNYILRLPPCVRQPEEKPCSTDFEKLYYPCKDK